MIKKILRPLAKLALKSPAICTIAKEAWKDTSAKNKLNGTDVDIPEISPLYAKRSEWRGFRLNLLLPGISPDNFFGGAATAVDFFERLLPQFDSARIIVTDEIAPKPDKDKRTSLSWPVRTLDDDEEVFSIVAAGDRYGKQLSISEADVFIATAWWTAHAALQILRWQDEQFGSSKRKFIYLIQDYEPGFYAWSSRWLLADATYRETKRTISVFNTSQLSIHLLSLGYKFDRQYIFEPRLNSGLRAEIENSPVKRSEKKRSILIYGRPNVERNAYSLIILGLKEWATRDPSITSRWDILSAGTQHVDVPLPNGKYVKSLGKLSIKEYAEVLRSSAIGISLMVSPHPSYPPLEMAAFGLSVITNSFGVKQATNFHCNINGLDIVTPTTIADALIAACNAYENGKDNVKTDANFSFPYLSDIDAFEFAKELACEIKGGGVKGYVRDSLD